MEALAGYGSDDDVVPTLRSRVPDIAPAVNTTGLALVSAGGPAGAGIVVPVAATKNLLGAFLGARARRARQQRGLTCVHRCAALADPTKHIVFHNPRFEDLHAPVAGPAHPYRADGLAAGQRNHPTGFVEVSARAATSGSQALTQARLSRWHAGRARRLLRLRRAVQHLPLVRLWRRAIR